MASNYSSQLAGLSVTERQCAVCSVYFVKNRKGFRRKQLIRITSPRTISKVFHREGILYSYICEECRYKLVKHTVRNKSAPLKTNRTKRTYRSPATSPAAKRVAAFSTPETSRKLVREPQDEDEHHVEEDEPETSGDPITPSLPGVSPQEKIKKYIDKKQYLTAFRALHKSSEDAKSAMVEATCEILKSELSKAKRIPSFSQEVSAEAIESFSWAQACKDAKEAVPATVRCIEAMTLSLKATINHCYKGKGSKTRNLDHDEAASLRCQRVGRLLSTILYQRSRKKYSFVQGCVGIELWRQRVSHKVFLTLNHMGITQGVQASRNKVDVISKSHDKQLWEWKHTTEERRSEPRRKLSFKVRPIRSVYSFCCDNIQVSKHGKHQRSGHANTFMLQTMSFAVKDRVTTGDTKNQVPASKLDPYTFLPSPEVLERQRERATFIVRKILLEYIPQLQHLKDKVPQRILHKHTKDMQAKSECVTLGVVDADPGTTQGMIRVMENLQQYVPVVEGKPVPCLLNGDGLTIERILNAQRARSNGEEWDDRLEGLHACPQEFHKEMLHLQDSNKKFFNGASLVDRGTIAQLKNNFNHRSFQSDVMKSFQHVWELYQFSTEGHVLLCAMKLCGMKKLDDIPEGLPTDDRKLNEQISWIDQLSQQVVDFCWTSPDQADVHVAAEAFSEAANDLSETALQYCVCHSESNDNMVMCCSRTCKHSWFHLDCVGLTQAPDPDTDWFCSPECEQSDYYIYCICHRKHGPCGENEMIQCHLADKCKRYEWYHRSCLGIKQDETLQEPWYCGDTCALGAENDDPVLNHTKALMYDGLCHLVRREAVREGNGPAMIDDWKADMLHFHEKNHPKYFINGHYLLACVGGFADPQLQISYMWNRVANATGEPGGNIGLDQTNEHVNMDYKEMLLTSRGRFTEEQVKRCAEMSGPFGSSLDAMLTNANVVDMGAKYQKQRRNVYEDDIVRFVEEYEQDALFDYLPGREHSAFQGFVHDGKVHDPKKLGKKLKQLSNNLDMWKNMSCNDNSN
ncbi:uncharacterized protein LOC100893251 [Strongylocentrotus purpuratus]|uniref:Zinc finger PHD-type domain-containing protein n=1 Tax=Strongylocentrotus purpuratus TaxID=7668 RepID=A0A7M7T3Z1_STRPU|nr:uncharacterized protein LOC100893251 [Strongylocentrotus purpuratus]